MPSSPDRAILLCQVATAYHDNGGCGNDRTTSGHRVPTYNPNSDGDIWGPFPHDSFDPQSLWHREACGWTSSRALEGGRPVIPRRDALRCPAAVAVTEIEPDVLM